MGVVVVDALPCAHRNPAGRTAFQLRNAIKPLSIRGAKWPDCMQNRPTAGTRRIGQRQCGDVWPPQCRFPSKLDPSLRARPPPIPALGTHPASPDHQAPQSNVNQLPAQLGESRRRRCSREFAARRAARPVPRNAASVPRNPRVARPTPHRARARAPPAVRAPLRPAHGLRRRSHFRQPPRRHAATPSGADDGQTWRRSPRNLRVARPRPRDRATRRTRVWSFPRHKAGRDPSKGFDHAGVGQRGSCGSGPMTGRRNRVRSRPRPPNPYANMF